MLAVYPHAPNVACLPIAIRCSWYHKGIGFVPGGHHVQEGIILVCITDILLLSVRLMLSLQRTVHALQYLIAVKTLGYRP